MSAFFENFPGFYKIQERDIPLRESREKGLQLLQSALTRSIVVFLTSFPDRCGFQNLFYSWILEFIRKSCSLNSIYTCELLPTLPYSLICINHPTVLCDRSSSAAIFVNTKIEVHFQAREEWRSINPTVRVSQEIFEQKAIFLIVYSFLLLRYTRDNGEITRAGFRCEIIRCSSYLCCCRNTKSHIRTWRESFGRNFAWWKCTR